MGRVQAGSQLQSVTELYERVSGFRSSRDSKVQKNISTDSFGRMGRYQQISHDTAKKVILRLAGRERGWGPVRQVRKNAECHLLSNSV